MNASRADGLPSTEEYFEGIPIPAQIALRAGAGWSPPVPDETI
jgi:hypothetical protein